MRGSVVEREVVITFLEMHQSPDAETVVLPEPLQAVRSHRPSPAFYRFLYETVGEPWYWLDRLAWSDERLEQQLQRPEVELWVLYEAGTPIGYSELVVEGGEVQLAYFGLVPGVVGQGWGKLWLAWTLQRAWSHRPSRVWLHTCTLDHPAALPVYQKLGFRPYDQVTEVRTLPRREPE